MVGICGSVDLPLVIYQQVGGGGGGGGGGSQVNY